MRATFTATSIASTPAAHRKPLASHTNFPNTSVLLLERFGIGRIVIPEASGERAMRLHLDNERHETQMCLGLVIAIMILTGSAILYMGTRYQVTTQTIARMPLASPL